MSNFRVGSYVTHSNRPEWGIGKIYCQSPPYVLVGFEHLPPPDQFKRLVPQPGLLAPAPVKANAVLDAWSLEYTHDCRAVEVVVKTRKKRAPAAPKAAAQPAKVAAAAK